MQCYFCRFEVNGLYKVLAHHRAVLEARCQPDRGRPQAFDVVEAVDEAQQFAAVVEAAGYWIQARDQRVIGQPRAIVRCRAVLQAVCHDEVENPAR